MKRGLWDESADAFLSEPSMTSKFSNAPSSSGGVVARRRPSQDRDPDPILRAVFASFIDIFCDALPVDVRANAKSEFVSMLVHLKLVPTSFFSDDFSPIRKTCSSMISSVLENVLKTSPGIDSSLQIARMSFASPPSRYKSDFEEMKLIGEGGFGSVYKVRSTIDNCLYAVKKIKPKRNQTYFPLKVLREVQTLASLQHENIVRYHSGWVEVEGCGREYGDWTEFPATPIRITEVIDSESSQERDASHVPKKNQETSTDVEPLIEKCTQMNLSNAPSARSSSFNPSFSASSLPDGNGAAGGRFWGGAESTSSRSTEDSSADDHPVPDGIIEDDDSSSTESAVERPTTTFRRRPTAETPPLADMSLNPLVYIQMELCTMTLEDYLFRKTREGGFLGIPAVDGSFNRELTIQLLSGIEYIHNCHLIHRDIKPSNIFLKHNGNRVRVLLGDFGLACRDHDVVEPVEDRSIVRRRRTSSVRVTHSVGVGTHTYAAPEQLNSKDYGPLVDIYSAGVVLFEAYMMFATKMERTKVIGELRDQRRIDEATMQQWPTVMAHILQMTDKMASKRPTASQLLEQYKCDASKEVARLHEIIASLQQKVAVLSTEVVRLKGTASESR